MSLRLLVFLFHFYIRRCLSRLDSTNFIPIHYSNTSAFGDNRYLDFALFVCDTCTSKQRKILCIFKTNFNDQQILFISGSDGLIMNHRREMDEINEKIKLMEEGFARERSELQNTEGIIQYIYDHSMIITISKH